MGTEMVVAIFGFLAGFFLRHGVGRYFERMSQEVWWNLGAGTRDIISERLRQRGEKGFSIERDVDEYKDDELLRAAICYAFHPLVNVYGSGRSFGSRFAVALESDVVEARQSAAVSR